MATRKSKSDPSISNTVALTEMPSMQPIVAASQSSALVFNPLKIEFLTDEASPFRDKYSIAKEQAVLADYIASGAPEDDPLYDRYIELIDRKDQLDKMKSQYQTELGADFSASHKEATGMRELGRLVDADDDSMEVHTLEAYRMFLGRRPEPGTLFPPIIGGKRTGAVLRSLWLMTGKDNPYADWALVRHEQSMEEVAARLDREISGAEESIAEQRKHGISLSILRNEKPAKLTLGWKSPYGFATATLINRFDYFIRLQKTLARKDLRTDDQVRKSIHEMTRIIRRVWQDTSRFDRGLSHEEVKDLCRADFVEGSDEAAGKRVEYARQVFGIVPAEIFTCALQPKHSRRGRRSTPQERALLQSIGLKLAQQEKQEAMATGGGSGQAGTGGAVVQELPQGGEPEAGAV
ncbi:MAG: TIGR03761 family integrating conjugative element protein [Burkholderiaceae bacterium]|jgi:integrating conjugative element protein (TIGR03761 family)|nr:TIGR03761 family integrating conjugative element protein [Burkholderiaceae bacterium]